MAEGLKKYFPMIRTREEIYTEIGQKKELLELYRGWNEEQQNTFMDYCTGQRGVRVLSDSVFKEVLDPLRCPERVEELLSLILKQKVKILQVLPLDSPRIGDEQSLVVMDLVVELEDRSIVNLEVQRIGYQFPGERAACYSADLLLRQYRNLRDAKREAGKKFSYRDIKNVYTVILYEKSTAEFHQFPDEYMHYFAQKSDTGLKISLLQEYVFIPLDIFKNILQNKGIRNKLEAWLTFLSVDEPETILKLITEYPQFDRCYEEIYELCRNTEKVMEMYSKELQEMDRNTVQYMIDEMQGEINEKDKVIQKQSEEIQKQEEEIQKLRELLRNSGISLQ